MNPLHWLGPDATTALSLTLLHSLWQVGVLVGILWCVERLFRRLPVERSYTLHVGMLLLTLMLLPTTFYWVQLTRPAPVAAAVAVAPIPQATTPSPRVLAAEFPLPAAVQGSAERTAELDPTNLPGAAVASANDSTVSAASWWPLVAKWFAGMYLIGVLVMLARLLLGIRRAERVRRRATLIEPGPLAATFARLAREIGVGARCVLATSRDVLVPTVVGVLKPTVLLPASALTGLSALELEMILLHELAHVRRHDQWVNLAQRLAEVVLFFNPALWYLSRRIATLREYCCDELTCRQLSPGDTSAHVEYAATLLHVVELARPASPIPAELTALAATGRGPSELRRRVARLFGEPLTEPVRLSRPQGILLLALALVLVGAPFARSSSESESDKPESEASEIDNRKSTSRPSRPTLRGQITDTEGKPIEGVRVVLYGGVSTRFRGQQATTDVEGRYQFTPLQTGAWYRPDEGPQKYYTGVKFEHPEYVPADGYSWRDIYVPIEHDHVEQLDVQMIPGGKIRGTVVDANTGKPMAGLNLLVHDKDERLNDEDYFLGYAETDKNGKFETSSLFPSRYVVEINDGDFEGNRPYPRIGQVRVKPREVAEVDLTTADLLVLQDPFHIEGSAIGDDGKSMIYGGVGVRVISSKQTLRTIGGGIDGRNIFNLQFGPIERHQATSNSPYGVGTHAVELFGGNDRFGYKLVSRKPSEPLFVTDNPNQPELENGNRYIRPNEPVKFELVFAKVDEGSEKSEKSHSPSTNNTGGILGEKSDDGSPSTQPDQARIAALEELVNSYTQVHNRIEALYKHGIRRNESLQQARLALEVAKGDLAYAKGDLRQAVEYYELAVAAADEGVKAIALAEDKSLVTLDVLLDAHRRRAEVKTTLNRLKEEMAKEKPNDTTSSSTAPATTVPIQCLDADDKPVAGAEVYVFQHEGGDNGKYRQFGPFTTDADGRATCGEALFTSEDGHFDRFYYARVSGKLVGVARSSNWKQGGTYNPEGRVDLRPSRSVEGHVVVPAGFDPTKVNVRVVTLSMRTGPGIGDLQMFPRQPEFAGLNDALNETFECVPDAEGKFEFKDVPIGGGFYLVTKAEGLAEGQWYTFDGDYSRLVQIPLAKEGRLKGIVTDENGEPLPGIKVAAQINPVAGQRPGHLTTFRATSDEQGKYELVGLPEWDLVLRMNDPEEKFAFCPSSPFFVASGTETKRDLTMEIPVEVRGRVIDADGKPVEGATLSAVVMDAASSGVANATSAADGQFAMKLPSGSFTIYVNGLPPEFNYPDPSTFRTIDIKPGQQPIDGLELRVSPKDITRELTELHGGILEVENDSQPLLDVMAQVHGYKPAEGKVLAHVASPFDVIRLEYYRAANSSRAGEIDEGPTAMTFRWDGENLSEWGSSFGDRDKPGYTITGLLDVLLEQKPQSISGPKSLLDKPLAGDWVMQTGAGRNQVVAELEEILRNEFGMKVRLRIRNLERDVYVATGRYQFKPIDNPSLETDKTAGNGSLDRIQVFANKLTPQAGAGGGSGEVDRFLLMVGRWIGTTIVSELGPPSQRHVSWRLHNTVGTTPEERRENHEAEIVLANITRQTGIEFKKDRRSIEVLFVEEDEESVK